MYNNYINTTVQVSIIIILLCSWLSGPGPTLSIATGSGTLNYTCVVSGRHPPVRKAKRGWERDYTDCIYIYVRTCILHVLLSLELNLYSETVLDDWHDLSWNLYTMSNQLTTNSASDKQPTVFLYRGNKSIEISINCVTPKSVCLAFDVSFELITVDL